MMMPFILSEAKDLLWCLTLLRMNCAYEKKS